MEVLLRHANPNMAKLDKGLLAKFIGESKKTTISRNQYVRIQYRKYQIPSLDILSKLDSNDYQVRAYWLPSSNIQEVYIYQGDTYLGVCKLIEEYNEATAEKTSHDEYLYKKQASTVSQFDSYIKTNKSKIHRIEIIEKEEMDLPKMEDVIHEVIIPEEKYKPGAIDYAKLANDNF